MIFANIRSNLARARARAAQIIPAGSIRARVAIFGLAPFLVYLAIFCVLNWTAIPRFSTAFYGDEGDGLQNLWNISHVRYALSHLQSPFFAREIHFPEGTTLLGHTLSPVNSFSGALLESFLTPFQSYNTLVIFSFCASGLAGFLLAYYFCHSYWPSLIAGFIYGFSGYQMTHAGSQINITSLEWLPVFLIFFHLLLTRPRLQWALLAWLFLTLTFYSELYYFFYGFLLAVLFAIIILIRNGVKRFAARRRLIFIGLFLVLAAVSTGPYIYALMSSNQSDPFQDNHQALSYSEDALGPFAPSEGGNFLGWSVLLLLAYAIVRRKRLPDRQRFFRVWLIVLIIFYLLSLGPVLHLAGRQLDGRISFFHLPMLWNLMIRLLPMLRIGALPYRMIVISIMAASVISALAMSELIKNKWFPAPLLLLIALIIFFEFHANFPSRIPSQPVASGAAYALAKIPGNEAVFEVNNHLTGWPTFQGKQPLYDQGHGKPLFDQMVHGRPIFGGYISRRPASVVRDDARLYQEFEAGDYGALCQRGFRYVITDGLSIPNASLIFSDASSKLFDLAPAAQRCQAFFSRGERVHGSASDEPFA